MTRKRIVIELVVLIVVVVVFELISSFSFSRHYHAISLSNASCIIPIDAVFAREGKNDIWA